MNTILGMNGREIEFIPDRLIEEPVVFRGQHRRVCGSREDRRHRLTTRPVDAQYGHPGVDRAVSLATVATDSGQRRLRRADFDWSQRALRTFEGPARGADQCLAGLRIEPTHDADFHQEARDIATGPRVGVGGGDDQLVEAQVRHGRGDGASELGRRHVL